MLSEEGILLELQEGGKVCAFDMNPFYCIDCAETHESAPILVGPYQICESGFRDSIVPQFEKALKNEAEHPVKVNNIALDINNYTAFFSREFLSEWRTKQLEYATPIQQRLYCGCGEFLGRSKQLEDAHVFLHCRSCRAITCSSCGKAISELRHHCTTSEKIEDAFANLKRGDDYQLCPNETCKIKITLADGCNHMTCAFCRTDFCFICGNRAKDRSAHWSIGNPCPRFGKKGSPRAIYDRQQQFVPNYFRINAGNRRQMILNTYRNINAIGRDPAGAGQVEAEDEQIMATPRGRLYSPDFDILQEIHDRIMWQESYDYPYGPTVEELRVAHSLVHRLEREMEVYITDMRVHGAPATPFRDDPIHRTANERIRSHVNQLGGVVDQYAGFRNIILSYTEAWEGRTDQMWDVRQG